MLKTVMLPTERQLNQYAPFIGDEVTESLYQLGRRLNGARVLHLNATARGGGVAELLGPYVALSRDLGLSAEWMALEASSSFFAITKKIHNGLQGAPELIEPHEWDIYEQFNREFARELKPGYKHYPHQKNP